MVFKKWFFGFCSFFVFFVFFTSSVFASPDVPVITNPVNANQNGNYRLSWSDESASGATSYGVLKKDNSSTEHSVSAHGNAGITGDSKFGSGALVLDGSGDFLHLPDSSDWDVSVSTSENWTIDLWFKTSDTSVQNRYFVTHYVPGRKWAFHYCPSSASETHGARFQVRSNGVSYTKTSWTGDVSSNVWHHIAMVKKGILFGIYIDGQQLGYTSGTYTFNLSGNLYIGSENTSEGYFDGSIDALRIQKSNIFNANPNSSKTDTIVVPTGPPVADANTKLILNFDGSFEDTSHAAYSTQSSLNFDESGLSDGQYKYWIQAIQSNGAASGFSDLKSITVDNTLAAYVPTITAPSGTLEPGNQTVVWTDESFSGAVSYELQVSNQSDFSNILNTFSPTSNSQVVNFAEGTYFLRVKSKTGSDVFSNWSSAYTVSVVIAAPEIISVESPPLQTLTKKFYEDSTISFKVNASASQLETLQYKFKLGNRVVQDYSLNDTCSFSPLASEKGRLTVTASVLDSQSQTDETTFDIFIYRRPVS